MFGYVLHESLIQFPKVLTSTEISKRLKIGYKAASLLKRRFQLFCSDQLPKYKDLTYNALNHQFKDFLLPPNEDKDISSKMANKPYVCVDTAVLYSAGERANKGRKRYSSKGQTSSIYLSPKLGGKQIGTLVQTIGIKNGPVFFTSVPNQKAETLGPIIKDHIPTSSAVFTDFGYSWLWGVYRNHRSVNHSARSKDNRFRWARNRYSKNGIHSQVAEGNNRLLKTAFASYGWIKPEYSTLYLNEFSFIKNANVFGLDVLVDDGLSRELLVSNRNWLRQEPVKIRSKRYVHKESTQSKKNWLSQVLNGNRFKPENLDQNSEILSHKSYGILNSPSQIEEARKALKKELESYNSFWNNDTTKRFRRDRELEYQKIAFKIWNQIHLKDSTETDYSVERICEELKIPKHTAMTISRKWLKLKLIVKRRVGYNYYDRRINFYIKVIKDQLPYVLYTNFRQKKKISSGVSKNEK